MKSKCLFVLFILSVCLLACSCMTFSFDLNNLQPTDFSLSKKLPNLEIVKGNSTYFGMSDSVSSSSYIYTVFKRELQTNVLDSSTEPMGSIEMILDYNQVDWEYFGTHNKHTMEFEIVIKDNNGKEIWSNVYNYINDFSSKGLAYVPQTYQQLEPLKDTIIVQTEHILLDEFKRDIENDYPVIMKKLGL